MLFRISLTLLLVIAAAGAAEVEQLSPADKIKQGHSRHGKAFDAGPREKPWVIPNIGAESVNFPITTKNPEVQKWFNQGVALLHSFWDYEAERAFRWALRLEPDNAMVYWGLARSAAGDRGRDFLREAMKRKKSVTERERLYIEALEEQGQIDPLRDRSDSYEERNREYRKKLESICVKYPDDMEARALLAYANMGNDRYGAEMMIREILAKKPNHPGAHHYRIHNWNYHEPQQALESCKKYGSIAFGSGHALHMPGHVYATVGMWNEAAISMDAATRLEKKLMSEQMTFPFNHWNYGHNRNYLSYIQEQLGMAEAAMFGARQLIDAPLDPQGNQDVNFYSSHAQGKRAMLRVLTKYERWKEMLDPKTFGWGEPFPDKMYKAYAETRAHIGLGDLAKAELSFVEHTGLKAKMTDKEKQFTSVYDIQAKELKARIQLARGERLPGLALLAEAAELHYEEQKRDNDPPNYPEVLYTALGHAYLDAKSPQLAAEAFEKSLTLTQNDIFALSGAVRAYAATKDDAKAKDALARLLYLTSDADSGLKAVERAMASGVKAEPKDNSPSKQRNYKQTTLTQFGPAVWEPYAAPKLDAFDSKGKTVTLDQYKGKNVLLVFYLGKECVHCMKQLKDISAKKDEWDRLDTVVLAVSPNPPESNAAALKNMGVPGVRILSDKQFRNATVFKSFDDFEEMELHSTILIDKKGRVHWSRNGGEPFGDMGFLVKQLERMNKAGDVAVAVAAGGK